MSDVVDAPASRAALLSELNSLPAEAAPEAPAEAVEAAADTVAAVEATEAEGAVDEAADPADEPAAEVVASPPADAELSKRLEAIQKNERRAKEAIAAARAELEAERKKYEPDLAELAELRELKRRARLGDASALLKFGEYADDDAELVARSVFTLSKAAQANPAAKEAAAKALRERETVSKMSALEQRLEALQKEIAERDQRAEAERHSAKYLEAASKAVDDSTPILRNMFNSNPELARSRVAMARDYLHQQTGEVPDPADVLKELEIIERNELVARGIDPDLVVKSTATKQASPVAGEKRGTKTLSNDLTTQTKPRAAITDPKEARAQLLKELESGKLDI